LYSTGRSLEESYRETVGSYESMQGLEGQKACERGINKCHGWCRRNNCTPGIATSSGSKNPYMYFSHHKVIVYIQTVVQEQQTLRARLEEEQRARKAGSERMTQGTNRGKTLEEVINIYKHTYTYKTD